MSNCFLENNYIYISTPNSGTMTIYKKKCSKCDTELHYTNKRCWYNAKSANSMCKPCQTNQLKKTLKRKYKSGEIVATSRNREREKTLERNFHRNCPECGNQMNYASEATLKRGIKDNTMCNACSTIIHKKGVSATGATPSQIKQMRATKAGFKNWKEYVKKYPKKQFYKREVWKHTYKQPIQTLKYWSKRGRCGVDGAYQLDHIQSINYGWENNVSPEQIADISNLRMLPWKENRTKGFK